MAKNTPGTDIPADYAEVRGNSLLEGMPSRQVLGQRAQTTAPGSADSFGVSQADRPTAGRKTGEALLSDSARAAPTQRAGGLPGQTDPDHGSST